MIYEVIRTCYYKNRLYEKGERVELKGNVPEHFSLLAGQNLNANKEAAPESCLEHTGIGAPDEPPDASNEQGSQKTKDDYLESMSLTALKELAANRGLALKTNKKADIIAALRGE